jgi:hypothetical protein
MVLAGGTRVRPCWCGVAAPGHALRRLPAEAARVWRRRPAVLVADPSGLRQRYTLGQLLPHSFGPET